MEQGTETGAWTSVHSAWEPESPVPEGLDPVPMASVRYLLDQMPDSDRNHRHLRKSTTSSSVALSGPVPWALLRELSFNQGHPLNVLLGNGHGSLIKLPEMISRVGYSVHRADIDALENRDPERRANDREKVAINRKYKAAGPPIILMRTKAKGPNEP
eukprot:10620281-Heterocapsa_arctica.AAC.1